MEAIHHIEIIINIFLQSLGAMLTVPMKLFSFLGQEEFFLVVMPALYWCVSASWGLRLGVMLILSQGFNHWLKLAFTSPRPSWVNSQVKALVSETSFGLPSGHAMTAASMWGLAANLFKKRWFSIVAILIVFLIGLSRIELGVHFTSDVLIGWLAGGLLLVVYLQLEKPASAWVKKMGPGQQILFTSITSLLLVVVTLGMVALRSDWTPPAEWLVNAPDLNPLDATGMISLAGVWLGLACGMAWWNYKHGMLKPASSLGRNFIRYAIGTAGLLILWYGLGLIFPRGLDVMAYILRYVRYAIVGGWISLAAPTVFMALKV
jgi:membrane-associated phospholipid phosphatase